MYRIILKSKIHRAKVTDKNLHYEGSISIDKKLMKTANILPFERVSIYNIMNGERFDTYAIEAEEDSGQIILNGASARLVEIGDLIIITSYALYNDDELKNHNSINIFLNEDNKIIQIKSYPLINL